MRPRIHGVLLFLLSIPVLAQPVSIIRFDPPDPTPRTPVLARIHIPPSGCGSFAGPVTRSGSTIIIALQPSLRLCLAPVPTDAVVDLGVLPAGVYDVIARESNLPAALAEDELAVRDLAPPFDVQPNTGGSGIDIVRLFGTNLGTATGVRFGSNKAEVLEVTDFKIAVKEPMLDPGTYDVTIDKPNETLVATAAYHVPKSSPTKVDQAFYERVLFPVFSSGSGAFGAQWRTDATLFNGSLLTVRPADSSIFLSDCFPICNRGTGPKQTIVATAGSTTPNGVVELLPRQATANIDFDLDVRDTSRDAQDLGTAIPVIREAQLFARTFSIPNIPNDPRYRLTLRLYDVDGATFFGVRFISAGGLELLPRAFIALRADAGLRNGGYATINDLLAAYPQLAGKGPLRLEIDPDIRNGARAAWGFVTVTNNETQRVKVIAPQ